MGSPFILSGKDFHKIDNFTKANVKVFEVRIDSIQFFFSDLQLLLISNFAYEFILKYNKSFIIKETDDISTENLVNFFNQFIHFYSHMNLFLSQSKTLFLTNIYQQSFLISNFHQFVIKLISQIKLNIFKYIQLVLLNLQKKFKIKLINLRLF
jgi:hypothetical protein